MTNRYIKVKIEGCDECENCLVVIKDGLVVPGQFYCKETKETLTPVLGTSFVPIPDTCPLEPVQDPVAADPQPDSGLNRTQCAICGGPVKWRGDGSLVCVENGHYQPVKIL